MCLGLGALLVLAAPFDAFAAKFNRKVNVGQKAPDFQGLIGIDDKQYGMGQYKDARVLVICFTCNHCPVAKAYEERLIELTRRYKRNGVVLVAINISNFPADRLDRMKRRAKEQEFNFDYLYDASQKSGREYGATVTPQVFVLDHDRRIAYMGAFDDSTVESKIKRHYVHDAVHALLEGKKPEIAESRQRGCLIQYAEVGRKSDSPPTK